MLFRVAEAGLTTNWPAWHWVCGAQDVIVWVSSSRKVPGGHPEQTLLPRPRNSPGPHSRLVVVVAVAVVVVVTVVGGFVGKRVGCLVGLRVGAGVGALVGERVGDLVGKGVGCLVGDRVGARVGDRVGGGGVGASSNSVVSGPLLWNPHSE